MYPTARQTAKRAASMVSKEKVGNKVADRMKSAKAKSADARKTKAQRTEKAKKSPMMKAKDRSSYRPR